MAIDFPGLSPTQSAGNRGKVSDQQNNAPSGAAGQPAASADRAERPDTVKISDTAQALQRSVDSSDNSSGVDSDRVARIKAAIEDGSYQINNERIADRMLQLDDLMSN
ncbi:flagellar biosynthesis anti-sigma factor FlgM [Marinobacterium sp. AK62]|uniref:Negative regulator of flagellin synthesis n=1 Tax=Marinobacterium alkalitolerans TaxID=1542925 RepID=A0ABS3ZA25_9GAMM|nr:flagellar biosynthesis anti-sigma factor FlgM [Marinobacterium alkalitolerans]MBP0048562.1 flagellar biosynthesis anti-sigma factor FlgM [Marinobacterium alkalitolerans]